MANDEQPAAAPQKVFGRSPTEMLEHFLRVELGVAEEIKRLREWIAAAPDNHRRWPGEE
jgi:hypothetical protein